MSWIAPADLEAVDALARLQLMAIRRGVRLRLHRPSADLVDLLRLAGLSEVLPGTVRRERPRSAAARSADDA